jgi:putative transposase
LKLKARIQTRKATIDRHAGMACKVYVLKLDESKFNLETTAKLERMFLEAKWWYNHLVEFSREQNLNDAATGLKLVSVKVGEALEERELQVLPGSVKQDYKAKIFDSLKALKTHKSKGRKVGQLKFKSRVDSIPIFRSGGSHRFDRLNNTVRLQKIKQKVKVTGLSQIPAGAEIANSVLAKCAGAYYLHVTTYQEKSSVLPPNQAVGIDFGCRTQLTLSTGIKLSYKIAESKRLKTASKELARRVKGSKNWHKTQISLQKAHEKVVNQRKDTKNKIVHTLVTNFRTIAVQDEQIAGWHKTGHGKAVQHSAIGGIISALKTKAHTPIVVSKWFPSTKLCPQCGVKNKTKLSDLIYSCQCGYSQDRDLHAARNILSEGLKSLPADRREFTPVESTTNTLWPALLATACHGRLKVGQVGSLNQEALARV